MKIHCKARPNQFLLYSITTLIKRVSQRLEDQKKDEGNQGGKLGEKNFPLHLILITFFPFNFFFLFSLSFFLSFFLFFFDKKLIESQVMVSQFLAKESERQIGLCTELHSF